MQAGLLDEHQPGDGDDRPGHRGAAGAGQRAGRQHHQCGNLSRAIDVLPAGCDVGGDDERGGASQQGPGDEKAALGHELAGDAAEQTQQRERADAGEPGARASSVTGCLPFEADRRAAEGGDDERHCDVPRHVGSATGWALHRSAEAARKMPTTGEMVEAINA